MQVVWFKRDLRVFDHKPLTEAAKRGDAVFPIYIAEPSIWGEADLSIRHFQFVTESLKELSSNLKQRGTPLYVAVCEIEEALQAMYDHFGNFVMHAHEENGTLHTFERDERVRRWMKEKGLTFHEYQAFGVVRGLKNRSFFQKHWTAFMEEEVLGIPETIRAVEEERIPELFKPSLKRLGSFHVDGERIRFGQQGGEVWAHETLDSFLNDRFQTYNVHISKPLQSSVSCSRLSPYLAWGNISMRAVVRKTNKAIMNCTNPFHKKQLQAFSSRLHWHCHFIQRIEDEPYLAVKSINPAFDAIRTDSDPDILDRWFHGKTGIPMIDACMRCLHQTGWINFRSRAMILSFICNTMMQDWRKPAVMLARLFVDYEPGIHYSQVQMQAGTTGFNTIRIYNPVKQGKDHDPEGQFIRRYVHELKTIPNEYVHEPWLYPGFYQLGYVPPIVDVEKANRHARNILWSLKNTSETKELAKEQLKKHGSRMNRRMKKQNDNAEQLSFDLFKEE